MLTAGLIFGGASSALAARPLVIAHRGASGERPEHTRAAYLLAIAEGADFIEPDLVTTKDGILVVRHENEISQTTDVARRRAFAARRTTKQIDGEAVTGWFTEDFTLAELKRLRTVERLPKLRPANARYDGRERVLTFQQALDLARREGAKRGRPVGVYPELKHAAYFASIGLPLEDRLLGALKANHLDNPKAPVFVQSFEIAPLKTLRPRTRVRLVQLIDAAGGPADAGGTISYAQMITPRGLHDIAGYADAIGVDKSLIDADPATGVSALVTHAHAAGLGVHAWSYRAENSFLPAAFQRGAPASAGFARRHGDVTGEIRSALKAGVDGVFSDYPALAVQARDAAPTPEPEH